MNSKDLIDKINKAIDGKYEVSFYYKPDSDSDSGVNGLRFGQLHVYGQNHKGNDVIRVFQTAGATSRRRADKNPTISPDRGYRTFKVANIRNFTVMDGADGGYKVYDKPVSGLMKTKMYKRQDGQTTTSTEREVFNPDGDNLMVRIYNQVDFNTPVGPPEGQARDTSKSSAIPARPITKPDTTDTTDNKPTPVSVEPADDTEVPYDEEPPVEPEISGDVPLVEPEEQPVEPEEEEDEIEKINENNLSYLDFLRKSFSLGKK